jgi:hypothetical protein
LRSEEVRSLSGRQLTADKRFDLAALEVLHPKVPCEALIEEVGLHTFGTSDEIRMRHQDAGFEPVRPRQHRLPDLTKLIYLII